MIAFRRAVPLSLIAFLAACSPETDQPEAGAVPADDSTYQASAEGGQSGEPSQRLSVDNPMDHPMVVTATYGGESRELGTVNAHQSGEFYIQAPAGTQVQLVARDSASTHQVQGTVQLTESYAQWTIR